MAAQLHILGQTRLIDTNGIADGASIYFYLTGTLTPTPVYTDETLTTEFPNPIPVAAGAAVPNIYLDSAITYRRRIVYPDGSVDDTDPYTGLEANGVATSDGSTVQADLDAKANTADLASTDSGKGAALVGLEAGGNVEEAIRYVTPEMFGGDIQAAADYAAANNVALMTGPVDYELTTSFAPHDITWISNNTRIKQMTTSGGVSVLRPQNNVKHIGRTYLWLYDAGSGSADRAHVVYGNWATGVGFQNFHFDEFVLEGGHNDCNGFSVTGGSSGVRGRRIEAAAGSKIGRLFMAHWANFNDHFNSGGTYQHAPDATPTTHPYDIVIDEVVGDLEIDGNDFSALWAVSAGYDIHARKVSGSCVNNGAGTGELVLLTAGDLGLAYATADELAAGMWGLTVGQVNGSCSHTAVRRIGLALYNNADSTPQPAENYFTKIQDTVGEVDVYNTVGNASYGGVDGHNGRGRSRYGSIKAKNFRSSANCSNYTRDFKAEVIEAIDSQSFAIQLTGSGTTEADWPTSIDIGTIRVNGTGVGEVSAGNSIVTGINKIIGLHIGTIIIDKLKDIAFASPSLTIGADVHGVTIDVIQQNWTAPSGQTLCVSNTAGADKFVDVGHIKCPAALIPVSGGVTSRVVGRNREYHYFGGGVPAGITVRVGDTFKASSATSGQSWLSIVTTAGVTGTDAVVTGYLTVP